MKEWIDVGLLDELTPGNVQVVDAGETTIAVFNLEGKLHAIANNCSHDNFPMLGCGLPLEQLIDGNQVICPRHGARFDIRTGAALTPPAYEPVATYPVRVEYGLIQVFPEQRTEDTSDTPVCNGD
ncbi:MAG: non-heme iron oxygenase ferredoxin subunit [Thiotrichales bacterium]|nr:non-heme iron oxygenase ferredoxin subunit [Thiotrichales bacterium]